jgi:hypothetical protein
MNSQAPPANRTYRIPQGANCAPKFKKRSQETLTYSPPIADGGRLYLRGEAYLYCIGEK